MWISLHEGMKRYGISLGSLENGVHFREEKARVLPLQET
jgi:hypothetical protein